jgi:MFS family permease
VNQVDKRPTLPVSLERDRATVLLYATLGMLGFLLNGLGSVLDPLKRQLHVDRAAVAFYPSLFAVSLIVVGLFVGRVVERLGHRTVLVSGIVGLAGGAALLATPERVVTLLGAVLLGVGGALLVQVIPAALSARHPAHPAVVLGEANAVSSWASVLAPAAVATAVALHAGWWAGYTLPVLPLAVLLLLALRGHGFPPLGVAGAASLTEPEGPTVGLEAGPLLGRWVDVLLSVSVEFCLVFWAADALRDWHGAGPAASPALAAAFLVGMALGRTFAARMISGRHPLTVVLGACVTAFTGFAAFWGLPFTAGAAAGLLLAGMGVALLYPVTLARLIAAWPHAQDRAAARGALASGVAIGIAPLVLARLADGIGLRVAYLIVPLLLLVLGAHAATSLAFSGLRTSEA